MKHRWGEKAHFPLAHKSERACLNGCGITKVHRYEREGDRDTHWTEFWRDGEKIEDTATPSCRGKPQAVSYNATGYPL